MLFEVESKLVIAGHTGRIHLEEPTGRTKVLLVKTTVCNTKGKNEE